MFSKKIELLPKVKKEIDFFEKSINKMDSSNAKARAQNILIQIKNILAEINVAHNSSYNGFIAPQRLQDSRQTLNQLRHSLKQIIKNN